MPRKTIQPDQVGPAWDAFLVYWKRAKDRKDLKACAWRAFHSAYTLCRPPIRKPTTFIEIPYAGEAPPNLRG